MKARKLEGRLLAEPVEIATAVGRALAVQPVVDLHTHLYPPSFGTPVANAKGRMDPAGLMLWGVDELLTYHYLAAELFRVEPIAPAVFWKMGKIEQADLVWKRLFLDRSPVSEACRGVLTTLAKLGLDVRGKSLNKYRKHFYAQDPDRHTDTVMKVANVESITMTNDVFDDNERERWLGGNIREDSRFKAVLRIDPMIVGWPAASGRMAGWGFRVKAKPNGETIREARRFLYGWLDRMKAIYIAASLPPRFAYPARKDDPAAVAGETILKEAILPVCAERRIPFAAMIGSERGVNPEYRGAGDMPGRADVRAVTTLCREFPGNRFLVTMLSRENQHELAVAARKFPNFWERVSFPSIRTPASWSSWSTSGSTAGR